MCDRLHDGVVRQLEVAAREQLAVGDPQPVHANRTRAHGLPCGAVPDRHAGKRRRTGRGEVSADHRLPEPLGRREHGAVHTRTRRLPVHAVPEHHVRRRAPLRHRDVAPDRQLAARWGQDVHVCAGQPGYDRPGRAIPLAKGVRQRVGRCNVEITLELGHRLDEIRRPGAEGAPRGAVPPSRVRDRGPTHGDAVTGRDQVALVVPKPDELAQEAITER